MELEEACRTAKQYLEEAIKSAKDLNIGKGNGPVNHLFNFGKKL